MDFDSNLAETDPLKFDLGQGPCHDALQQHEKFASHHLGREQRWPTRGPCVVEELGMRSILSSRLFTTDASIGARNLEAARSGAFRPRGLPRGQVLAAHAAVGFVTSFKESRLHRALETRR